MGAPRTRRASIERGLLSWLSLSGYSNRMTSSFTQGGLPLLRSSAHTGCCRLLQSMSVPGQLQGSWINGCCQLLYISTAGRQDIHHSDCRATDASLAPKLHGSSKAHLNSQLVLLGRLVPGIGHGISTGHGVQGVPELALMELGHRGLGKEDS